MLWRRLSIGYVNIISSSIILKFSCHTETIPNSFAIVFFICVLFDALHNLQFHSNFRIRSPSSTERSFDSALAFALETREGTAEEVAFSFCGF